MTELACLSPTIASTLLNYSALHAWQEHSKLGGLKREPTPAMDRGKILESIIFKTESKDLVIIDAPDFRKDDAKAARDQAREEGKIPVLSEKLSEWHEVGNAIIQSLHEVDWSLDAGEWILQERLEWESEGCPCKGFLDARRGEVIVDLKCVEDARPWHVQRILPDYGYDLQHAAYTEGVETLHPELAGRTKFIFLFCEINPPYAVLPAPLAGSFRDLGKRKWDRAKRLWAECLRTNIWPSYPTDYRIAALPWQVEQGEDPQPTEEGEGHAENHD
jgi:hypothetical protein